MYMSRAATADPSAPNISAQLDVRAKRGHPVIVLPGFMANDLSTTLLRTYLRHCGFDALCWAFGRNAGPVEGLMQRLRERVCAVADESDAPISLVGHSLGGIYAREIAKKAPRAVRSVVTLGSPIRALSKQHLEANGAMVRLIERAVGHSIADLHERGVFEDIATPPPVPCTAIYSRRDRIAPWLSCLEAPSPHAENVEVSASHRRMLASPEVFRVVADRLRRGGLTDAYAAPAPAAIPLFA